MKKLCISAVFTVFLVVTVVSYVLAAGFQVPEQGAASMGMGMGGIAKADDLSAIYHNPAGLAQLKGTQIYLSSAGISPQATYTRKGYEGEDTKDDLILVPLFAVSTDFGKFDNLVFAFAVNAPFGLRSDYDNLGAQRYMSTNISLSSVHIGPYVAWQAMPKIAIGGGVQYVYSVAEVGQHINYGGLLNPALNENPAYDGVFDVKDASAKNVAANVGILVKPLDKLQIGLMWSSGKDLDIEGDVSLTIPAAVTQLSGGLMQSLKTTGEATVSLPQVVGLGVAYKPIDNLTLIGDVNWIDWSVYKNLDFDFKDNTAYFPDAKNPRGYDDTVVFRLGAEYWLHDKYAFRAGYIYDPSPIPDKVHGPELPTNDRQNITLGFGYRWNKMTIDLAYAHLFIKDRTVTESLRSPKPLGDYECSANVFGIGLTYKF
ncbi:membrane protein involved in aromatic hydrocarbon degradation [Candidatus Vecturithrix granuli]|uniref:Membrane protein involved in aromatic hydrocarbon degradation n=1 Tax=Vecturithrix granuli TaxID=1499967 RepID=A0A081BWV7_VECG1|nr:membrane protein involved in aromatic hydrocarbon degradation [Candidatus Vecturithrix granuli]